MLKLMIDIGSKIVAMGSKSAAAAIEDIWKELTKTPEKLNAFLQEISERLTPIEVTITCVPTGVSPEDYYLQLDHFAFSTALKSGQIVRPQIVVKASRQDLNRDLLAERLLDALEPLFEAYDSRVAEMRHKEAQDKFIKSAEAGLTIVDIFLNALVLCLIGAGAMLGPIFWLAIGIGGVAMLMEMPSFIIGMIKHTLFGTPIEQMEKEVTLAKKTIRKMVNDMTIIVNP